MTVKEGQKDYIGHGIFTKMDCALPHLDHFENKTGNIAGDIATSDRTSKNTSMVAVAILSAVQEAFCFSVAETQTQ